MSETTVATNMPHPNQHQYILGADHSELARLLTQAEDHRGEAERLLDELPLGRGARALDVGCGPIGVLDLLSERVGSDGEVVGLDYEPRVGLRNVSLSFATIHRKQLIDDGFLSADELDGSIVELTEHLSDPDAFVVYTPLFQAWGRKPA